MFTTLQISPRFSTVLLALDSGLWCCSFFGGVWALVARNLTRRPGCRFYFPIEGG